MCSDARIVTVALEGLENILKVGEVNKVHGQPNQYAQFIDEAEGLEKIEDLQNHTNNDIYDKAVKIMEEYFGLEDEEDQNLAPAMDANANQFAFAQPGATGRLRLRRHAVRASRRRATGDWTMQARHGDTTHSNRRRARAFRDARVPDPLADRPADEDARRLTQRAREERVTVG